MDVFVSVAVFLFVCVAVLVSYLYVLKINRRKHEERQKAWRKEVSRQKRSNSAKAAALRKSNPELAKVQAQQQQDAMNSTANMGLQGNLGAFNSMTGKDLYGRGDL